MLKKIMYLCAALGLAFAALCPSPVAADQAMGSFIQLTTDNAGEPDSYWKDLVVKMKASGIDTVIVQWSAQDETAYFESPLPYRPQWPVLERIFRAVDETGEMSVYLGLELDTNYWVQITGPPEVLHDYFRVRVAGNEKLQRELLRVFGSQKSWKGYYIPDEIDDLTWRQAGKASLAREYLSLLVRRLRAVDETREICVSAFFRSRTSPKVFAETLREITAGTGLDALLIQDGMGGGDPPATHVPYYFAALREAWTEGAPDLWGIVEVFTRISWSGDAFHAVPAHPQRVAGQIALAKQHFPRLVLFSFPDYVDPAKGEKAASLFQYFKNGVSP